MTVPFLSVRPRAIKLKVSPRFPALLVGRNGIAIDKESGNYFFDLDYTKMPFSPVLPPNNVIAVYDPASGHFTNIPATQLGGGITTDAPLDGFTYGRNNAGWARALDLALGGAVTGNVALNGSSTFGGAATFNATATFTGQTIVPSPSAGNQAANKTYVDGAVGAIAGTALPLMNGAAAVGVAIKYSREDHVHPTDASRAAVASPAFTGVPTAPTPTAGDNSTKIATTAFVAVSFAPLNSPAFAGTPTAPTAAVNTNTAQLATTAFVVAQAGTAAPLMNGVAAVGASLLYARQDHVHPSDSSKIGDAPSDGNMYARKNAAWSVITGGGGGGANVYVQDTAPVGATAGSLWWNSSNGQLYVYYYDGNSTQWVFAASGGPPAIASPARNYIVNGGMMVSQENGSTAVTVTNTFAADQWVQQFGHSGAQSFAQVVSPTPGGSPNRIRVSVTTAAAITATSYSVIQHKIEGLRSTDLKFGTANAKSITVQFGVKAPAGVYTVCLRNGANNRGYSAEFTISAGEANTDVVKSVTIPGDTTGTWPADNTPSLDLAWALMVGSSYAQPPAAWAAGAFIGSTNNSNFLGTNGNVFELFDVGLYQGTVAPAFQVPDYATELALCKRYCYLGNPPARGLVATATTLSRMGTNHPVPMRASPTLTVKANINVTDGVAATTVSSITTNYSSADAVEFDASLATSLTAGRIGIVFQTGTPGLLVSARM